MIPARLPAHWVACWASAAEPDAPKSNAPKTNAPNIDAPKTDASSQREESLFDGPWLRK